MAIKERVLASMKTSYAKYGFKKDELTKMADIISKNLKEESTDEEIANILAANEGFAQMMQSVYNRGVSETSEKYKDYIPKPKEEPEPKRDSAKKDNSNNQSTFTLEDVKKIVSEELKAGLQPYKEREERQRLQGLLFSNSKLKDVPQQFCKRYNLAKEEDAEKVADEIVNDWTAIQQNLVQSGKFVKAPMKGEDGSDDDSFRKMMEDSAKRVQDAQAARAATTAPKA